MVEKQSEDLKIHNDIKRHIVSYINDIKNSIPSWCSPTMKRFFWGGVIRWSLARSPKDVRWLWSMGILHWQMRGIGVFCKVRWDDVEFVLNQLLGFGLIQAWFR